MDTGFNEFAEALCDIFEETEPEELSAETNFLDIPEWSSLTALSLVAMVKMKYQKSIDGDDIASCSTLGELYNLISSK